MATKNARFPRWKTGAPKTDVYKRQSKTPAEISYMDANCTKWSYATPTTGRMPESGKEVAMEMCIRDSDCTNRFLGSTASIAFLVVITGFTINLTPSRNAVIARPDRFEHRTVLGDAFVELRMLVHVLLLVADDQDRRGRGFRSV